MEKKDDYKALCAGLKFLPNVTKIIVIDKISEFHDHHSCYHERSQCEIAVPFLPSSWELQEGYKWDVRGIQHLIRAVSQHGNHVVQLHMASGISCVPIPIFGMDRGLYDDACRMVRRLDLLEVHLYAPLSYTLAELREQKDRLSFILSEAKNLRCLALSGDGIESTLLKNMVWPHLESLSLRQISLRSDDLKPIIKAHKDTLRKVSLREVSMSGVKGLADIIRQDGKYLSLRQLTLHKASVDVTRAMTDDAYLKDELRMAVPYGFMRLTPLPQYMLDRNQVQVTMHAGSEDNEDSESHSP